MKIKVDTESCIASGACVVECPQVFDQDEEGLVVLLQESPPPEFHTAAHKAMAACPVAAIEITEDD